MIEIKEPLGWWAHLFMGKSPWAWDTLLHFALWANSSLVHSSPL